MDKLPKFGAYKIEAPSHFGEMRTEDCLRFCPQGLDLISKGNATETSTKA